MAYNIINDYTNIEVSYVNGPVTVTEAKAFCRVDFTNTSQDALFAMWVRAARTKIEQYTGLSLIPRNIVAVLSNPQGNMELPFGPVSGAVTFVDENGTDMAVTTQGLNYPYVPIPFTYAKATYQAGFADGQVPDELKQAILLQVAYWWANRGDQDMKGWSPQVIEICNKWKR